MAAIATADVSEPPRPRVVTSPSGVTPWKPVTTRTLCASSLRFSLSRLRSIMRALLKSPVVVISS